MYDWREASPAERARMLSERKLRGLPWHGPPHLQGLTGLYHICAACYEHEPYIGTTLERLRNFTQALLETLRDTNTEIYAWCVLINHYHVLLETDYPLKNLIKELGKLHGRTSFKWNGEENCRGRKVWCNVIDRWIRGETHFWTALNYIHHNPVKHSLVKQWQEWPYSSAHDYLDKVGREKAQEVWVTFPVKDYGVEWLSSNL